MAGSKPARRPSVAIASELALVAETVGAGLVAHGFGAITIGWPVGQQDRTWHPGPLSGQEVGLLISDLDSWELLRTAWLVVTQVPLPWVVLTAAPPGPIWGAALDAGACLVMPSTSGLKPVCKAVTRVARGTLRTVPADHEVLIGLWTELLERRQVISEQVGSLTPREHEVLIMLHAGDRIDRIAQLLQISPVTVRSQVKAVLRKLEVNSQLGAVAALDDLVALEPWP